MVHVDTSIMQLFACWDSEDVDYIKLVDVYKRLPAQSTFH